MNTADKLLNIIPKQVIHEIFCEKIKKCRGCLLHKTREKVVVGRGHYHSKLMLIGEAPGEEEDKQGVPFVGKAGKLLDQILDYIGLPKIIGSNGEMHDVYITNAVLCRPPNNRTPLYYEEMMVCRNRLICQIYMIKPKLIVLLGKAAVQSVLQQENVKESVTYLAEKNNLTLKIDEYSADIMVTYHPSYLLRQPSKKTDAAKHWDKIKSKL